MLLFLIELLTGMAAGRIPGWIPLAFSSPTTVLTPSPSASLPQRSRCFDFSQTIRTPLREFTIFSSLQPKEDRSVSGQVERDWVKGKIDFASVEGLIERPILEIYTAMLDPRTVRDKDDTEIQVQELDAGPHLKHTLQTITIKPLFFLTIEWSEDWSFSLLKGTRTSPEVVLVSYEKREGTSHLRHLCGNILLEKTLKPQITAVHIYEELIATQRNAQDTLKGVQGTIANLRSNTIRVRARNDSTPNDSTPPENESASDPVSAPGR